MHDERVGHADAVQASQYMSGRPRALVGRRRRGGRRLLAGEVATRLWGLEAVRVVLWDVAGSGR